MAIQRTILGAWPLTMARTTLGSYVQIMAGDPVAEGLIAPDDLARLVTDGALAVYEIEVPDPEVLDEATEPTPATPFDAAKGGGVKETLAYVGDDAAKAAEMLELEEARDTPRVTLVEKLEAVIEKATTLSGAS